MADIVFRYEQMTSAAGQIRDIATRYKAAADNLQSEFAGACGEWEGDSKDAMTRFMTMGVNEYTGTTIPQLLNGLADLLEGNAEQMKSADAGIAENIPSTLG
jgi:WXG100 family type VII secretion target